MTDSPAQLHGPGGLLATPGGPRRRRWGKRRATFKAKQIVGQLYRADDGKFQSGGGGGSPKAGTPPRLGGPPKQGDSLPAVKPLKKPKGGRGGKKPPTPKKTEQERQAERDAKQQAALAEKRAARDTILTEAGIDANTQGALIDARDGNVLTPTNGAKLAEMGLAEQAGDGSYRLTPAGRSVVDAAMSGDAGRARDTLSKARDTAAPKPEKPEKAPKAGGGGAAPKPDKGEEKLQTARDTASQVGLTPGDADALRQAAETGGVNNPALASLGFLGPDGRTTDQGRRALVALERGDVRGYQAAVQDATARMERESASTQRAGDAANKRADMTKRRLARDTQRAQDRQAAADRTRVREAQAEQRRREQDAKQKQREQERLRTGREKSFAVFKDASGAHRWIARTTTAYEDRDQEIIAAAALDLDSQRMMATNSFGPLRWWHVGQPNPLDDTAPWGPGLDLGMCDFSMLIGRTRVESGTFQSAAMAQKVAAIADDLELSPGFFHPLDQPTSGVYTDIRTFERSLVPVRHGRASNLFTGLTVKERRMDPHEMERRFKAAITTLGLNGEQATALGQQLVQTEKDATARGIAFKEAQPAEEITINGVVYTVKAAPPPMEEAAAVVEEVKAPEDGMVAEEPLPEEPVGEFVGDMTPDAFFARLTEVLAPVLRMQEMVKTLSDGVGELKSMQSGVATKDNARAQELAAIRAELVATTTKANDLAATIAAIEGNQPAVVLPDELSAALKSAGPQTPPDADPNAVQVPNDPNRPWAALAAHTFPELYQEYGPNGWVKQQS